MKIPISWIKEYVDIKEGLGRLAEDLQFTGTKIEAINTSKGDSTFEFEITPNRPDCLGVIGISREIAAIYNRKLSIPASFSHTDFNPAVPNQKVRFKVLQKELCPNYSLGLISLGNITSSPQWLVERLERSGIRSINAVVDVTNYVMLETGQPMHAFDWNKIKGQITLRESKKDEQIITLDGVERTLPKGAIIIEDEEKIIDLAGLMGARVSETDQNTTTILLQVPIYDPLAIRKTSQAVGLRSEASNRFEKKLDPNAHRYTFERVLELLHNTTSGRLVSPITSVGFPVENKVINVSLALIKDVLGLNLKMGEVTAILERLDFAIKSKDSRNFTLEVPSFRTDINAPIDIVEEVGRLYGFNKFPKTIPLSSQQTDYQGEGNFEINLKYHFALLGLKEIYSSSLLSARLLENSGIKVENCLRVANRLVVDHEYLRPTLFIGLLQAILDNRKSKSRIAFFEFGKVFTKGTQKDGLPLQEAKVAAIFTNYEFRDAKGVLEGVLQKLGITNYKVQASSGSTFLGGTSSSITIGKDSLGIFGDIGRQILERSAIEGETYFFELDLELLKSHTKRKTFTPNLKFPTVKESISMFLPDDKKFEDIAQVIKKSAAENYHTMSLIEDTQISGKRSVLIQIEYFHQNHTLKQTDVEKIRGKILDGLKAIDAQPRIKQ